MKSLLAARPTRLFSMLLLATLAPHLAAHPATHNQITEGGRYTARNLDGVGATAARNAGTDLQPVMPISILDPKQTRSRFAVHDALKLNPAVGADRGKVSSATGDSRERVANANPQSSATTMRPPLPLTQNGGTWPSGHVQGIAVDTQGGFIYYSFTSLLAKYDFNGRLIGTLTGWSGHLGDLDFNADDGRVYGSLEYKKHGAFYIAVIDVGQLDRVGMNFADTDLIRTVNLAEVVRDYFAMVGGADRAASPVEHRYGCSGIDGVSFGPAFGRVDGPRYLSVAYGIFADADRSDNDHQIILQYDVAKWEKYLRPLDELKPHLSGPESFEGKYFVRTGNTTYGVQNLSYDSVTQRWFLGVYKGIKDSFPNYTLFAVDGQTTPVLGDLVGVPAAGGQGWERGLLLDLADDGLHDPATGVRGWNQKADVGLQPVGDGLFYLAVNSGEKGRQTADLTLMRWTGDDEKPFSPVAASASPINTTSP